eukprot:Colp12_sorted_trinity150504_noHs@20818
MDSLKGYGSSGEDSDGGEFQVDPSVAENLKKKMRVDLAPSVVTREEELSVIPIDPHAKQLSYNPKYDELFAAQVGPENPNKTAQQKAKKNILTGYVEPAHMSEFDFEEQRRTFQSYGYAMDPTAYSNFVPGQSLPVVGDIEKAQEMGFATVFDRTKKRVGDKRKREDRGTVDDISNFKGPWAGFKDEIKVSYPTEEETAILEARKPQSQLKKAEAFQEKSTLHISDAIDYLGRSFLHPPVDVDVDLRTDEPPEKCFLPKKLIHTWTGHSNKVCAVRLFPGSGHLMLSCSMDQKVKLWEVYGERRVVRTYQGHLKAVRDVNFNNDGTKFLSCGYDNMVKLWDTETGQCISKFTNNRTPYCCKFNPKPDRQHMICAGTSDKKIMQWDINTGQVIQEYDRHLGPVNSITFVDGGDRFVTTSDDRSIRVWEWEIPVDIKYIADPGMHAISTVSLHPNGNWFAGQ